MKTNNLLELTSKFNKVTYCKYPPKKKPILFLYTTNKVLENNVIYNSIQIKPQNT